MQRNLRNTVAVLLVTAFTALAIFATVQLTARVTGIADGRVCGGHPDEQSRRTSTAPTSTPRVRRTPAK